MDALADDMSETGAAPLGGGRLSAAAPPAADDPAFALEQVGRDDVAKPGWGRGGEGEGVGEGKGGWGLRGWGWRQVEVGGTRGRIPMPRAMVLQFAMSSTTSSSQGRRRGRV